MVSIAATSCVSYTSGITRLLTVLPVRSRVCGFLKALFKRRTGSVAAVIVILVAAPNKPQGSRKLDRTALRTHIVAQERLTAKKRFTQASTSQHTV